MSHDINLYEARLRPRREWLNAKLLGQAALAVLAVVAATALWAHFRSSAREAVAAELQAQVSERQMQVDARTKALAEQKVSPDVVAALADAREALAARTVAFDVLSSGRSLNTSGFSGIFKGFAQQAPENPKLWLTAFSVRRGGEAIEIRGRALDAAALPTYVQGLRRQPAFEGRSFAGLEISDRSFKEAEGPGQLAGAAAAGAAGPKAPGSPGASVAADPAAIEFVLRSEAAPAGGRSDATGRSMP